MEKLAQLKGHRGAVYDLMVHNDVLLSTGGDGWLVSWPIGDQSTDGVLVAKVDGKIFSMSSVGDHVVVLGDMHGHLFWVDLETKDTLRNVRSHQKGIFALEQVGDHLYSGSADGYLTRWSTLAMMPEESIMVSEAGVRTIELIDDHLYLGTSGQEIVVVDLQSWSIRDRWPAHNNSVFALAQHRDDLLSGGRDALLRRWSLADHSMVKSVEAHWYTINHLLVIDQIDLVVSASRDKSIRLWDADTLQPIKTVSMQQGGHINSVNRLAYHDGRLYSAGDDRSIIVWQLGQGVSI